MQRENNIHFITVKSENITKHLHNIYQELPFLIHRCLYSYQFCILFSQHCLCLLYSRIVPRQAAELFKLRNKKALYNISAIEESVFFLQPALA